MTMKRSHYVLLALVAGIGLIIFNPIGAFGLAVMAIPFWLWRIADNYMTRRHERKIAERIAEEEREAGPEIPVEQSILAQLPDA
jgi:hypothetical protein